MFRKSVSAEFYMNLPVHSQPIYAIPFVRSGFFPERASILLLIEIRFFWTLRHSPGIYQLIQIIRISMIWQDLQTLFRHFSFAIYYPRHNVPRIIYCCVSDAIGLTSFLLYLPLRLSQYSCFRVVQKIKLFWLFANKNFFFDLSFVSYFPRFQFVRLYKLFKTLLLWSIFGCFRFFDYRSYLVFLTPDAFSWSGLTVFTFYARERPNRIFEILCSKKTPSHFSPRGNLFSFPCDEPFRNPLKLFWVPAYLLRVLWSSSFVHLYISTYRLFCQQLF